MFILKLVFKNAFRHKLRTILTIFGMAIAVIAFGVLRTVVTAWYAGVDASSADRLITRQAVSFIFPMPYAYKDKIEQIPGIDVVSFANWFGGTYIDKSNFFARLAVDADTYFDAFPEFLLSEQELANFKKERNACIIGSDIAKQFNLKVGDMMTLEGDIYPGTWEFVIRGIYKPKNKNTDATQMFFQWDYLNELIEQQSPNRGNQVGWYIEKLADPSQSAEISEKIDALFRNSAAETKTETEQAFQQGFISASGAIITAMNVLSFVIVGIIMLVLANTMIMSARERTREYAVLKTLGFSTGHITGLIFGETMVVSALGGGIGLLLCFPFVDGISQAIPKGMFPVFQMEPVTIFLALTAVGLISIIAAIFPIQRALRINIVDGFRFVG
ncbi:MAG: ABC transporter permease [Calditrichae bacterium]|nr:ABC transporter permease [Calditrichota bacterium]MCB9058348.1 ABC transporter permease [Calditrichia bacterium]